MAINKHLMIKRKYMKFKIHKLARIEDATFEIKDLTVFVGKNSTNKSYSAHIVYILNKILSQFNRRNNPNNLFLKFLNSDLGKEIKNITDKLDRKVNLNEIPMQIDHDEFEWEEVREVIFNIENLELNKLITEVKHFLSQWLIEEINKSFNTNSEILKSIEFDNVTINKEKLFKEKTISIRSNEEELDSIRFLQYLFKKLQASLFYQ